MKRSGWSKKMKVEMYGKVFVMFVFIYEAGISLGLTNPNDVAAINSLYISLGSPVLPGWVSSGGDPCGEAWQGVRCDLSSSEILSITFNGANLKGELGNDLGTFVSIRTIDFSNNHIGGSIPSNLPTSLQTFFLSANNFTGSIPNELSSLALLTDMSLNRNSLSGEIPDAFVSLVGLINLDLSDNNLSGQLPPSFQNLANLKTLHLQDNQLSGTLGVLGDLSLQDLNVENNLFMAPIPEKLLSIANFKKDGNLFNTTASPVPAPTSPLTPPPTTQVLPGTPTSPSSGKTPAKQAEGPSSSEESTTRGKKFLTTKRVVWISIAGVLLFIILALGCLLFMPRCSKRRDEAGRIFKRHQVGAYRGNRDNPRDSASSTQPINQTEEVPKKILDLPMEDLKQENDPGRNVPRFNSIPNRDDHEIYMNRLDMFYMPPPPPLPPPPPPPPIILDMKVVAKPLAAAEASHSARTHKPRTTARSFSIASLQQYTNSFSQDNLIGGGMLGTVYRAQLPDEKLLAVKKLDKRAADQLKDDQFIELVNNIDRIRHPNIVQLMGYCSEHGQRLLIYEHCRNGTLQDALHSEDKLTRKLSWNARVQIALGAAMGLEYLHEVCEPAVVHRNFKAANILLDDDLTGHVSDCGLAPLISSGSVSPLSGHLLTTYGYGAPEFESGIYTAQSDVYSFGVVMLELLTGRKSHDRARIRGEQFLVRWAIPQLHDIDALYRMVDPSLSRAYPAKSLSHFADIISRCIQSEPEFRPQMSEVVQDLTDMIRRERPSNKSVGD